MSRRQRHVQTVLMPTSRPAAREPMPSCICADAVYNHCSGYDLQGKMFVAPRTAD